MLEGHHYQNAYITRNMDKWIEAFHERAKVDRVITYIEYTWMTDKRWTQMGGPPAPRADIGQS